MVFGKNNLLIILLVNIVFGICVTLSVLQITHFFREDVEAVLDENKVGLELDVLSFDVIFS